MAEVVPHKTVMQREPRRRVAVMLAGTILAGLLAVHLPTGPAVAQTVCVVCEAPAKAYSCSYAPAQPGDSGAGRRERALQMRCITELAQRHGHAQCKVNANAFASCAGEVYMLREQPQAASVPPADPSTAAGSAARPAAPAGPANAGEGAPKTVVELATRAAGATKKQIKESGTVVEHAMRQTWRCVTTLFERCSDSDKQAQEPPASAQ